MAKLSAPPVDEAQYEATARAELKAWQEATTRTPGPWDKATRHMQDTVNNVIPERVHTVVSATIEHMVRGILTGSDWTTAHPLRDAPLSVREAKIRKRIAVYRTTAAAEGGVAGAGGFMLAAAEFPVLLTTKIKLLFDIAALYGRPVEDFRERLFILAIFQLAFSSAQHRNEVYGVLADWDARATDMPQTLDAFDWRRFQQQYRDYIDLAKLAQLLPVIGAPVGVVVNFRMLDRLGASAMAAYRMRWFAGGIGPT